MDEITNAICMNIAERQQVPVSAVRVELLYDEDTGFSAEVWVHERSRFLIEANMKEAVGRYMESEYGQRVYPSQITFDLDDEGTELWADITN